MTAPTTPRDWVTAADAATRVDRDVSVIHKWLRRPIEQTGIRRIRPRGVTWIHVPTLLEYEATRRPGRPRKAEQ